MPAVSEKQARLMRAVAHSPEFAKKVNIPQSVGREFSHLATKALRKKQKGCNCGQT